MDSVVRQDSQRRTVTQSTMPVDIEHATVEDDPRKWSHRRKLATLCIIATAALLTPISGSIYNPSLQEIQSQLHANNAEVSLSISLFVIVQGIAPIFWSVFSELKGRKLIYIISIALFTASCAGAGVANTIGLLIGMRVLQGAGNAAVLAIGAGTLADIFEPSQRGTMIGIYYAAPLLGPSLGPIIGGALTNTWSWRACFYFLSVLGAILVFLFLFFKDTFRRERSSLYQSAIKRHHTRELQSADLAVSTSSPEQSQSATVGETPDAQQVFKDIHLSASDLNPFPPIWLILMRKNNLAVYLVSGLSFGLFYSIGYTGSLTLFRVPYQYNPLQVGLVLLGFGIGCISGSILGGRWSDRVLARAQAGQVERVAPEIRLRAAFPCLPLLPLSVIAYAWLAAEHVHIAALVVALFLVGFTSIWVYSSTLAYIVDANVGRSSTAVAGNSLFRGLGAFIASEAAVPLQTAIGDGGLYSLWAGLCVVGALLVVLVVKFGEKWRVDSEKRTREVHCCSSKHL